MCFVDPASHWYFTSVSVIIRVISCNIGPRYNGTPLFRTNINGLSHCLNKSLITVTSNEHHSVLNHWQIDCLFRLTNYKVNIKALHHGSFVRGIHLSPVDSPLKGPVIWKAFPCHDIIMIDWIDKWSGPRLNIKTVLSTYGDFHVKDKTAVRTSYL